MAGEPPPIPGALVTNPELHRRKDEVSRLLNCGLKFPGAQPVSFSRKHIDTLMKEDYFVCEKSDGVRLLLYCTETDDGREASFLIDRKNAYYSIPRLHFPLPNDPTCNSFHKDTIIDGELVLDIVDEKKKLVFLLFDLLIYQGADVRERNLEGRLGKLRKLFYEPTKAFLKANPKKEKDFPFDVQFKEMQRSYGIEMMFHDVIPKLNHGNDGLIFTSINAPYTTGTDETLLKWKPANENSVDFVLELKIKMKDGVADYDAIPDFSLLAYHGGPRDDYYFYDSLYVDEQDWEQLQLAGNQHQGLNNQVVECRLDEQNRWRFMRIRVDKTHGNHISIIKKVLESIKDGVTKAELERAAKDMKIAYKLRHPSRATAEEATNTAVRNDEL